MSIWQLWVPSSVHWTTLTSQEEKFIPWKGIDLKEREREGISEGSQAVAWKEIHSLHEKCSVWTDFFIDIHDFIGDRKDLLKVCCLMARSGTLFTYLLSTSQLFRGRYLSVPSAQPFYDFMIPKHSWYVGGKRLRNFSPNEAHTEVKQCSLVKLWSERK